MDAILVVVVEVLSNEPPYVGLAQHDHVVQQFPSTATNPAFRHAVGVSHQLHPMETLMHDVSE
jgi:hypothetical protein